MAAMAGSSPPARGTQGRWWSRCPPRRFIPACAGNTTTLREQTLAGTVHPRLRGEHIGTSAGSAKPSGSSPPARGTQVLQREEEKLRRFIPACAGNTDSRRSGPSARTVHPRLRGEHGGVASARHRWNGSSPPARGTHRAADPGHRQRRFIPACAGNTRASQSPRERGTVHPRLRGEHHVATDFVKTIGGSSPPARGTPGRHQGARSRARFIPACAGNTCSTTASFSKSTVHPRLRGEHISGGIER